MPDRLTAEERADILQRVAGDPTVAALDAFRVALRRFVHWPFSRRREAAVFVALEDIIVAQINRLMGSTGSAFVKPIERLQNQQQTQSAQMGRLEKRIADLESHERTHEVGE